MASEFIGDLRKMANEIVRQGAQEDASALARMAANISRSFAVQPDEVAVLMLTKDGKYLRFLLPERLQQIGQIPLTSTSSLAARTARDKRPEIINHFSVVPHASVFEAVRLAEEPGDPIQKIMSAPLTQNKNVVGVIQVSRKAKTAVSAGPDFTPQELKDLLAIADVLAPCVPLCAKD
jgi:hypothetical protein